MKLEFLFRFCKRFAAITLMTVLTLSGCSKRGPGSDISSSAFDAAPPEVKSLWVQGIAAWKSHRYLESATNFVSLQASVSSLSTDQANELTKARDQFGQEVFAAAEKGDASAADAITVLRGEGSRRSAGAR